MTTVSTDDPQFLSAIQACAVALRRLAEYELTPSLHSRLHAFGVLATAVNTVNCLRNSKSVALRSTISCRGRGGARRRWRTWRWRARIATLTNGRILTGKI